MDRESSNGGWKIAHNETFAAERNKRAPAEKQVRQYTNMRYGTMIIATGTACTLVLIALFYVLFLNREGETVAPILFKISAAVLAAGVILGIDLLRAPDKMHVKTNFLVLRNNNGDLLRLAPVTVGLNLGQWNAYNLLENIWLFSGYKAQPDVFEMNDGIFDELLAATFLKWLANHYHLHWETEHNYIAGISGGGGHSSQKENRDKETTTFRFVESGNGFLVHDPVFNEIQFPKGSKLSLRKTGLGAEFTVKNRHMSFTFKTLRLGNSGVSHSILGNKIEAHLTTPGAFYAHDYIITIDVTFSKLLRWSPQTNKQKDWLHQLFANFERDFNWDIFKPQLQMAIEELPEDTMLSGLRLKIINQVNMKETKEIEKYHDKKEAAKSAEQ